LGDVPASQSLIYAFDTNAASRANQDVGLDGLPNSKEGDVYTNCSRPDPADDYMYYLNANGSIVDRAKTIICRRNSAIDINDPNREQRQYQMLRT
jgi:cell surface protein SprA